MVIFGAEKLSFLLIATVLLGRVCLQDKDTKQKKNNNIRLVPVIGMQVLMTKNIQYRSDLLI